MFVIRLAVMLLLVVAAAFINVGILATSVILPKLNDAETFALPLAFVIVRVPKPEIFATFELTKLLAFEF